MLDTHKKSEIRVKVGKIGQPREVARKLFANYCLTECVYKKKHKLQAI